MADNEGTGDAAQAAVEPTPEEQFEQDRQRAAAEQGLTDPNAVPEQRPTATQESVAQDSALTQKLKDEGVINDEPMGKEAYDRASSKSQLKKAAAASEPEQGFFSGSRWRVTKGPHEGRVVALTRIVSHANALGVLRQATGSQEQNLTRPAEIECRALGDDRDSELLVLDVEEAGLERVPADAVIPGRARG